MYRFISMVRVGTRHTTHTYTIQDNHMSANHSFLSYHTGHYT